MHIYSIRLSEKARHKDYLMYDSIYKEFQKRQNYKDTLQISGCLGLRVGEGD